MTLIIKSDKALTKPLSGNPILANLNKNLILNFTFDHYKNYIPNNAPVPAVSSDGELATTLSVKIPAMEYPTLVHAGPNGHSALNFNGNQMLGITLDPALTPTFFEANEPGTFAITVKTVPESTSFQRIVGVDKNVGFRYLAPQDAGLGLKAGSDGGTAQVDATANAWHTLVVVFNGKDSKIQLDGGTVKTVVLSNSAFNGLRFGHTGIATHTPASAFIGQLAHVSIYKRVLSFEEINALSDSLRTRYGIAKSTV